MVLNTFSLTSISTAEQFYQVGSALYYEIPGPGYHEIQLVTGQPVISVGYPGANVGERIVATLKWPASGGCDLSFDASIDMGAYREERFRLPSATDVLFTSKVGAIVVSLVWAGDYAGWVCESLVEIAEPYRKSLPLVSPEGTAHNFTAGSWQMRGGGAANAVPAVLSAYVTQIPAGVRTRLNDRLFVAVGRTIGSLDRYFDSPTRFAPRQLTVQQASGLYEPGYHPSGDISRGTIGIASGGLMGDQAKLFSGGTMVHEAAHAVDFQYKTLYPAGLSLTVDQVLSHHATFQAIYAAAQADPLRQASAYGFRNQWEFFAETLRSVWELSAGDADFAANAETTLTSLAITGARRTSLVAFFTSAGVLT